MEILLGEVGANFDAVWRPLWQIGICQLWCIW